MSKRKMTHFVMCPGSYRLAISLVVLATAAAQAKESRVRDRLALLGHDIVEEAQEALSDEEKASLASLRIGVDRLMPGERRMVARVASIADALRTEELPLIAQYAREEQGRRLRLPIIRVLVHRGAFDCAIDAVLAEAADVGADRQSYWLWKWLEAGASSLEQYVDLRCGLALAMVSRIANAAESERSVLMALLSLPQDVGRDAEAVRKWVLESTSRARNDLRLAWSEVDAQYMHIPEPVWRVDRLGEYPITRRQMLEDAVEPVCYVLRFAPFGEIASNAECAVVSEGDGCGGDAVAVVRALAHMSTTLAQSVPDEAMPRFTFSMVCSDGPPIGGARAECLAQVRLVMVPLLEAAGVGMALSCLAGTVGASASGRAAAGALRGVRDSVLEATRVVGRLIDTEGKDARVLAGTGAVIDRLSAAGLAARGCLTAVVREQAAHMVPGVIELQRSDGGHAGDESTWKLAHVACGPKGVQCLSVEGGPNWAVHSLFVTSIAIDVARRGAWSIAEVRGNDAAGRAWDVTGDLPVPAESVRCHIRRESGIPRPWLHRFDFVRVPCANEALAIRVWRNIGAALEIDAGSDMVEKAAATATRLQDAARVYFGRCGRFPASLMDLAQPDDTGRGSLRDSLPKDPWGFAFAIQAKEGAPLVLSPGPDGKFDTEDDVEGHQPRRVPWPR